jgi:SAM-dependent methyltransferase
LQLDEARESVGTEGITFVQADIQAIEKHLDPSLKGKFDAVFSSATFHWCKDNPGGVVESVKWLLKPGGRMVWEMGGFGNTCVAVDRLGQWLTRLHPRVGVRGAIHQALRKRGVDPVPLDPWYFPTVGQYTAVSADRTASCGKS